MSFNPYDYLPVMPDNFYLAVMIVCGSVMFMLTMWAIFDYEEFGLDKSWTIRGKRRWK